MQTLHVALGDRSYPIHIGAGLLRDASLITPHLGSGRVVVVTNDVVAPLYLATLKRSLGAAGVDALDVVLPDGEAHKDWQTLNRIFDALLAARCDRSTTLLALGGGVVGDVTGFAAATYQRGVSYLQVPTTLLAQVDSSVGGKTAINHPRGKNMIGAFYQPLAVVADMETLATLPLRELRAGLGEVIKHGLLRDLAFFEWLEQNIERLLGRDPAALAHAVQRCCEIKSGIVALDERETGQRALLNLGHTFGHAIETAAGYGNWLHGEAVAAGVARAAELSWRLGSLAKADADRVVALLRRTALPVDAGNLQPQRLMELMRVDKKVSGGRVRFVILERLGSAVLRADVPAEAVQATLESARGL